MQTLNDLMTFGNVVASDGRGNVSEPDTDEYGPALIYVYVDQDGQGIKLPGQADFDIDMAGYGDWELLRGFTNQAGYNGALLHSSEVIGGGLERHIRENAGYYVAVMVDAMPVEGEPDPDDRGDSWAVAFKPLDETEI